MQNRKRRELGETANYIFHRACERERSVLVSRITEQDKCLAN